MSLTPADPIVPAPVVIRQIQQEEQIRRAPDVGVRKHRLIPTAAEETLRQWDEYRAAERARLDALGAREAEFIVDDDGNVVGYRPSDAMSKHLQSVIQDFPTPERIAQLPDLDAIDRAVAEASERRRAAALEQVRKDSVWYRQILKTVRQWLHLR